MVTYRARVQPVAPSTSAASRYDLSIVINPPRRRRIVKGRSVHTWAKMTTTIADTGWDSHDGPSIPSEPSTPLTRPNWELNRMRNIKAAATFEMRYGASEIDLRNRAFPITWNRAKAKSNPRVVPTIRQP